MESVWWSKIAAQDNFHFTNNADKRKNIPQFTVNHVCSFTITGTPNQDYEHIKVIGSTTINATYPWETKVFWPSIMIGGTGKTGARTEHIASGTWGQKPSLPSPHALLFVRISNFLRVSLQHVNA